MQPRISLITLGVADLARAVGFYQNVVGWQPAPSPPGITFFDLNGLIFALFPHQSLAEDMKVELVGDTSGSYRSVTLAHNVADKQEVDAIFARLRKNNVTIIKPPEEVFWGGYSGYFADPDGHIWEIAYNPFWTILADGRISMNQDT